MKRNFKLMIPMVLWFIIFLGTTGNLIRINLADKQTEKTTEEFVATIKHVEINDENENSYIEISVNEYDTVLYISENVCKRIDENVINSLLENDTVYFRIENIWLEVFEDSSFVKVVSLRTPEKEIFSLEDYNVVVSADVFAARIEGSILSVISLSIGIFFVVRYRKMNV